MNEDTEMSGTGTATITVDKNFVGMAVTSFLQMQGKLAEKESIEIFDWTIEDETEYLILFSNYVEETIN